MLNLIMKSLQITPIVISAHAATAKHPSRLQFLVREMRTFCTMLDELKRAQQA